MEKEKKKFTFKKALSIFLGLLFVVAVVVGIGYLIKSNSGENEVFLTRKATGVFGKGSAAERRHSFGLFVATLAQKLVTGRSFKEEVDPDLEHYRGKPAPLDDE